VRSYVIDVPMHIIRVLVAFDLSHIIFSRQCRNQRMQMLGVAQVHTYHQPVKIWLTVYKLQIRDIGAGLTNQCANAPQNTGIIAYRYVKAGGMDGRVGARLPMQVNPALRRILEMRQRTAVNGMHHDPRSLSCSRSARRIAVLALPVAAISSHVACGT